MTAVSSHVPPSPSQPRALLEYYRAIEAASRQMLQAAQDENWDDVVRLEGVCAVLIEQLRTAAQTQDLPPDVRSEKQRIMLNILRHDAQIRLLAEPWLADLEAMVGGLNQRQLH